MPPLTDRLAEIARWCVVAALFILTLPVSAAVAFFIVVWAVSR